MKKIGPRTASILDAALPVFARYGFHKTTMVDIARAAGISRASLYLAFNSKEELFRAGSARAHQQTMSNVEDVLSRNGDVIDRIADAISAFQEGLIAPFSRSESAKELFDINMQLAADITTDARLKLLKLLSEALADAQAHGEIDLKALKASPIDVATLIAAAMDGIKHTISANGPSDDAMKLLMRVLKSALNSERRS
ncbi:TetR/AcrR family transcriptional regulator [Phyllobacterium salinisoli]|uniref:TetR/AcrR family transcriptional regulator n=2 Tax=Phyllobacterium salinisoli TaxID=1899321 RepID=A0A368K2Y0_9HYPH|nr:TetR/AcrR family transcriptional regulator [Phyllobacterium salinisoli]RCS22833.1 TetR/AcrR family transcriptional regulator [Phyllobacterium salinisoli]